MSHHRFASAVLAAGLSFAVVGCSSSGGKSTALNQQPGKTPAVAAPTATGTGTPKGGATSSDGDDAKDGGDGVDASKAASSAADALGTSDKSGDDDASPSTSKSSADEPDAPSSSESDSGDSHSGGDVSQWCLDFSKALGDAIYAGRVPQAPSRDSVKAALEKSLQTAPVEVKADVATIVDGNVAMVSGDVAAATKKMNSPEHKAATDRYMTWSDSHC